MSLDDDIDRDLRNQAALFTAELEAHPGQWFKGPPLFRYGLAPVESTRHIYLNPAAYDAYADENIEGGLTYWFRRKVRPEGLPDG